MPPTLVTDQALTVTDFITQSVDSIVHLDAASGWVNEPHLYCNSLTRSANAYDVATLVYEIGEGVIQPGAGAFASYPPLGLRGFFVRITITTTPTNIMWIGYVPTDSIDRDAVILDGGVNKLVGKQQTFTAVGLEYFLDRKQIDSAIVARSGDTPDYVRIQRPLVFNGGASNDLDPIASERANRSLTTGTASYVFTDDPNQADLWTAGNIVDHLLTHHTPRNSLDAPAPTTFILDPQDALDGVLDGFTPTVRTEGMTVFQILNQMISPQRGLAWWLEFDDLGAGLHGARVRVESLAAGAIALPGGGTMLANRNQETLDFDGELDVSAVKIEMNGSRNYHQVIARGARMTSTLTVGYQDATLIEDWTNDNELAYKKAADDDTSIYDDLPEADKKKRNDAMRKADTFYRVYSAFRIPTDWDSKSADGDGPTTRNWSFPELSPTGSVLGGTAINVQGMRLLNETRLKRGWDYSDPADPEPNSPATSLAEFMPPFAILKVATSPDKFQFCDKMNESDFADGTPVSAKISTNYHLKMQKTVPGIILDSIGMNHTAALNHWTDAQPSKTNPQVDYETIRATICIEADTYCEGKYPTTGFPVNTPLETLVISLGDNYRLDYLPAHTITGLDKGELITSEVGAVLRDDRKYLNDVARMAYEWYKLDRQSMNVSFRQVRNLFELGMLITAVGSGTTMETINTIVSSITYNLKEGVMTVETDDDTLDIRSLVA